MWRDILKQRVEVLRDEFLATAGELLATQEHVQVLLTAVLSLTEDVGMEVVLQRVTTFACELAGAQHADLSVVEDEQSPSRFFSATLDPGQLARRAMAPAGSPPLAAELDIPIRIREKVFGNLHLADKAGGDGFSDEDNALCIAFAASAGVAIENARRRQWLEAGVEAKEQILTSKSGGGPEILGIIAEQARAASGSALALVAFVSADAERLVCRAAAGISVVAPGQDFPIQPALAATLDAKATTLLPMAADALGPGTADALGPAMALPLDIVGLGRGLVILARAAASPPYAAEDTDSGTIFSSRVVVAVERLREQGDKQVLLLSEDRDRIACDLHDRVIQRIFAAGLSLQSLRLVISDEASLERVTAITEELDASIRELRETIYSLRSPRDIRDPLEQRIMRAVVALSADASFVPRIQLTGLLNGNVPEATAESLLAVLTEGLSNAVRHAKASNVGIKIDVGPGQICLAISDDGDGFANANHRGGLSNMKHRAMALGGAFSIDSMPGTGTSLEWSVPLGPPSADASHPAQASLPE
ncbi:hypothetical protein B5P43_21905 [Bacillus sp. SRB_336]|nr:hypothetical protein B5P43_21905 [Bacillus sp. SRB_336]